MPGFTIHRITTENARLLDTIAADVFDHDIDPVVFKDYATAPDHALFVAVSGGVVIGQARGVLHRQPDSAADLYVDNLGVAPSRQREGAATQLIEALIAWGRANATCRSVWLATEHDNTQGKAFYAAAGFVAQSVVYYSKDF
jgi:aminoglycoside 6'-N-acetyltransferase I